MHRCKTSLMTLSLLFSLSAIIMTLGGAQMEPGREPLPPALMDKMERAISAQPCIGSMDKWHRRYSYKAWMEGAVYHRDTMTIAFVLAEAGRFEFLRGRQFVVSPKPPMIDDRSYKVAYGQYDLETGRVTLTGCGLNMPAE